tara:strand:+ start:7604 stop:9466 length:1863 start_codon:yes stop_codon:yes gene_type:complete
MKRFFPALNKYQNLIFCDNAGGSQLPIHVINNLNTFLIDKYVQPGSNIISKKLVKDIGKIDEITNTILNNKSGKIIYGNSTSQLMYNLSNGLENWFKKDINSEIILPDFNHEACITPFERKVKNVKWWKLDNDLNIDYNSLLQKVNQNTKLVVLPHVSNLLGNILDIKYLNKEIKKINKNTKVLVDGVAFMPHDLVDVDDLGVDFYSVSFYKFCGLRISALYINDNVVNEIEIQNHYFLEYSNVNKKLEIGGMNFETASSIKGLSEYIDDCYKNLGGVFIDEPFNRGKLEYVMNSIRNYEKELIDIFRNKLEENDEIEIIECKKSDKVPIFSLRLKNYNENNINLILNELGLICKNSTFYCDRFFENYNFCKERGVLRISLMHYNTPEEVCKIAEYINMFKKRNIIIGFSLESLVSDTKLNSKLKSNKVIEESFNEIKKDNYYLNKRKRAFSLLEVGNETVKIVGDLNFYQSNCYNNYNGNILRKYENIPNTLLSNELFKDIVFKFNKKVSDEYKLVNKYIQIHQIRVYADEKPINLIPEGIHQDGFNIVGLYCVKRENIKGGVSNIYDNKKNKIYTKELLPGELLILNDRRLYHDVTNIELVDKEQIGYRDIFVLTTID